MTSTDYSYSSLESEYHIRLLKILPGRLESSFSCELFHMPINGTPPYEALSYVWGDGKEQDTILCNGNSVVVGQGLSSVLYRLRGYDSERIVWIDAICIDQSNIPEKTTQLPLMRRIYQQAVRVLVWLGPESESCNIAISMISTLINVYNAHKFMRDSYEMERQQKPEQDNLSNVSNFIKREMEERTSTKVTRHGLILDMDDERCGLPCLSSSMWQHLDSIYNAKWFHRVWTLQEVIVAENVEVMFGGQRCTWDHFFYAAYAMAGSLLPFAPVKYKETMWLDLHRGLFREEGSLSLLMLLNECNERDATEPHDRIYALLGLAENQEEIYKDGSLLKPNYGLPVEEVYRRLAIHFLVLRQEPDILRAVYRTAIDADLPSWVPDWSAARPKPLLSSVKTWYHAGANPATSDKPTTSLHPANPNILQTRGKLYDTVGAVGMTMNTESTDLRSDVDVSWDLQERARQQTQRFAIEIRCWREWREMACIDEGIPYPSGEIRENAYWRTLIGDCNEDFSGPVDDGYRYNYKQWRNHMRRAREGFFKNPSATQWAALGVVAADTPDDEVMGVLHGIRNDPYFKSFYNSVARAAALLCFGVTSKGYFGLFPPSTRPGDTITIVPGVKTPMVLREKPSSPKGCFTLLGACFVHGLMNGEALADGQGVKMDNILIV